MENIRVVIADDEIHARERLRDLLSEYDQIEIVAEAKDGSEALDLIITKEPEVAFLDINMPGISVFQAVPSLKNPPLIVFQTAYAEHAAQAFDINAIDYLLKPIRRERLAQCLEKIESALEGAEKPNEPQEPATVSVKVNSRIVLIPVEEILRVSFEDGFCWIYAESGKFMSERYLNAYEEELEGYRFFRVSRTDLVNLSRISSISTGSVTLSSGDSVELSRRKAQALKKIL